MKSLGRSLLVATAALLLTALGFSQSYPNAEYNANGNGGVQTVDRRFMSEVAQDSMSKIDLAYLALQNSDNQQVQAFARQILLDYGNANRDLASIASQQFVELPAVTDAKQQGTFDALSQLHGKAFDKAYMEAMLKSNKTDVARLKQEASKGNNQSVIDWSRQMMATTENNLKQAQKIAPQVGIHSTLTSGEQQTPNAAGKPANTASPQTR